MRFTRGESGYESVFLDISHLPIVERYEFRCGYDSGKVFSADQDTELVLQRIAPGNVFTFFYSGMDGRGELRVKPYKEDGILYVSHGRAGSELVNVSKRRGDYVKLASFGAERVDGKAVWHVVEARGCWEKQ